MDMKNKNIALITIVLICLSAFPRRLRAQDTYTIASSGPTDIKVLGTSNLHNWTMDAKEISCSATFIFTGNDFQPQSLAALNLSIPVHNLKSRESMMDSRAYTALKADKFSTMALVLTSATIVPGQNNHFQVKGIGNLSIAGATKPVSIDAACVVNADGTIACSGSEQLKMSDYQIKPPSFMLGALRTGDDLTINFSLTLKK
jgi:polyisoprenoid-binding protein YceI